MNSHDRYVRSTNDSEVIVSPTFAQPIEPHPHIVTAITVEPVYSSNHQNRLIQRPPQSSWGDGIIDWPKNLFPSCWCTCCCFCGIYLIAQMSKKLEYTKFSTILWSYCLVFSFAFVLESIYPLSFVIIWMPLALAAFWAFRLRFFMVKKYNIRENGFFVEFCLGSLCFFCSVPQMARYVYGYAKILDGDADLERPDNYLTASQV